MQVSLVLTIIGPDRPGIVELLARTVTTHEANWLESRMASLAGQFAGILRVSVDESRAGALTRALAELESESLKIVVETSRAEGATPEPQLLQLDLVGNDHPGIVRDISEAFARHDINVEELNTECHAAPMAGGTLFKTTAQLRVPGGVSIDDLRENLEELANELMVDISLQDR